MLPFTTDHVFILPHAEEYRTLYSIPLKQVLETLNHQTLPLNGKGYEEYDIVDFIGYAEV